MGRYYLLAVLASRTRDWSIRRHHLALALNALVYAAALVLFGVVWWKSILIALMVFVATVLPFGTWTLLQLGAVLFVMLLAIWADVLPHPDKWLDGLRSLWIEITSPKG